REGGGVGVGREEVRGDLVDKHVRRLRAEHDGDEQGEGGRVVELAVGVRGERAELREGRARGFFALFGGMRHLWRLLTAGALRTQMLVSWSRARRGASRRSRGRSPPPPAPSGAPWWRSP